MKLIRCLQELIDDEKARLALGKSDAIAEIRLRAARPMQIRFLDGGEFVGGIVEPRTLERIICTLMDNSLYSRENELRQGYFTTDEGCRVGVCGKTAGGEGCIESFAAIGSVCIRIPGEARGCADPLVDVLCAHGLKSLLIVSEPGLGKTTMLRDMARQLSEQGYNVAIADERREIAACSQGIPRMDVGSRSDVMDGCAKDVAIPLLVRACAPDVIIADEIGSESDARALLDAVRCGVKVVASAHGTGFKEVSKRPAVMPVLQAGVFDYCAFLGPKPGQIKYLRECADEELNHAEGNTAVHRSAVLCGRRAGNVQCT